MPKHIHKYIRVDWKHVRIWKCADMYCSHFVYPAQEYIILGRASLCWQCGDVFPMDEDSMKEDMPRCGMCRNPEIKHIPDNDISDIDTILEWSRRRVNEIDYTESSPKDEIEVYEPSDDND